jgi:hypothetical protein
MKCKAFAGLQKLKNELYHESIKVTVQRDFSTSIEALLLLSESFSNLASNSKRYNRFSVVSAIIYSGKYCSLLMTENSNSAYSLWWRVACWNCLAKTLRIFLAESPYSPCCL